MTDDADHSSEPVEQVEAEPVGTTLYRAEEVCVHLGISGDILELCLRWEVIEPPQVSNEGVPLFSESVVERIRRGVRLHRDLGINWPGVAVVLGLLDRMEALERERETRLQEF
jgi:MerR HTH family regulatory protein